jgi:hypothetical protein
MIEELSSMNDSQSSVDDSQASVDDSQPPTDDFIVPSVVPSIDPSIELAVRVAGASSTARRSGASDFSGEGNEAGGFQKHLLTFYRTLS